MEHNAYAGHGLWQSIAETLESLAEMETPPNAVEHEARIRAVAAHVQAFSNAPTAYAVLFSPSMLDGVNQQWNQVRNYVNNHRSNPSGGYLANTAQYLDAILATTASWPLQGLKGGAAAQAATVFQSYQQTTVAELERLKQVVADLTESLVQRKHQTVDVENRLAALDAKITKDETRLDAAVTQQVEAFNDSQTKHEKTFAEWLEGRKKDFDSQVKDYRSELDADVESAAATLAKLEVLRDKTERVAGEATAAKLARDYGAYSDREFTSAKVAYGGGVALLIGAAVFLFLTIQDVGPTQQPSWQWVSLKAGLAATIVSAGTIAIRLGSRFLTNSALNKRIELELRAIGPFLADVEDAKSAVGAAKLAFVERAFGRTWDGHAPRPEEESVAVARVVDTLAPLISRNGSSAP